MSSFFHWSPPGWLGSGECVLWFKQGHSLPVFQRRVALAWRLGAVAVWPVGRVVFVLWPVGCVGSRLFAALL